MSEKYYVELLYQELLSVFWVTFIDPSSDPWAFVGPVHNFVLDAKRNLHHLFLRKWNTV